MAKMNVNAIIKEALEKSDKDRAKIAEALISSLETYSDSGIDMEKEWQEEINKRISQIDSGTAKMVSWSDVHKKLYGKASKSN